jgi:hypothetical protein
VSPPAISCRTILANRSHCSSVVDSNCSVHLCSSFNSAIRRNAIASCCSAGSFWISNNDLLKKFCHRFRNRLVVVQGYLNFIHHAIALGASTIDISENSVFAWTEQGFEGYFRRCLMRLAIARSSTIGHWVATGWGRDRAPTQNLSKITFALTGHRQPLQLNQLS